MSLAEIEKTLVELFEKDRCEFANWFYENQGKIFPFPQRQPTNTGEISPEVMEELLRRRQELEKGNVTTYSIEEIQKGMQAAVHEVRRSFH